LAALRSANIVPFMYDPAHQATWQWPGLAAHRTAVQQSRFYWRGRSLGGSSTVNAQIAIRGVPAAFDS
jgi:5-(hydroxymethyl)furfural/furfural oxidase